MGVTGLRARLQQAGAERAHAWALHRQGQDALPLTLSNRRIYILPTRAGAGLAGLLLILLLAGLNYSNNLALLLTFLLAGVQGVALVLCHRQLLGLQVLQVHAAPVHVGQTLGISLRLKMPAGAAAEDLCGFLRTDGTRHSAVTATEPTLAVLTLHTPAQVRGRWRLPTVGLETRAPLGLFRAWVWLHLNIETLIYPAALGTLPPPAGTGTQDVGNVGQIGQDEWLQLRPWRDGEALRQVAWKTYARGGPLQVTEYGSPAGGPWELDLAQVPLPRLEQRLSQLTQWLISAEQQGQPYSLRLPELTLPASIGPPHQRQCLTALALYGHAPASESV